MKKTKKSTKLTKPVKPATKPDLKIRPFSDLIQLCDQKKITHIGVTESSFDDLIKALERDGNRKQNISTKRLHQLVNEKQGIPIFAMDSRLSAKPGLAYGVCFKGKGEPKILGRFKIGE